MKPVLKFVACVLLAGALIYPSCKKENSCEGCINGNKPPSAMAGPDQVITLPTDSISMDGSSSSDPDGTISEWRWTKISGPASFTFGSTCTSWCIGYFSKQYNLHNGRVRKWSFIQPGLEAGVKI